MKKIRFFSLVLITCLLSVNALVAQYNIGTSNTLTGTIFNNDACPIIGDLCAPIGICDVGDDFSLMAAHLDKFIDTLNGDQSFGIEFVYFTGTTPPTDPYIGGTSLGTVPFANLMGTGPNQSAGITVPGNTLALGDYLIYAILSPAHNDPTCRPAQNVSLKVGDPALAISNGSGTNAVLCSNGAATLSADGFIGNAVKFAGTTAVPNFVEIPDDNSLDFINTNSFTIEAWINPSILNGTIISKPRSTGNSGYQIILRNNGSIRAFVNNGSGKKIDIPANKIAVNTWSHIAFVFDGQSLFFFVNGVQEKTAFIGQYTLINSSVPLRIGNRGPSFDKYYTGSIDEVRLWNTPRTQAEIQANMNHEIAPQTGLVAYYPFNESSGSCAIDASGTGNMGTFSFDPPMREIPSTAPVDFFSTYSWLPGGQTTKMITATANGTYTLTATAANGCTATASAQVNVNLPIPVANAGIDQIVCAGQSVTLNATGGSTYAWTPTTGLSNPNIANPIASPTDTTVYTVTVTGVNGCSAVDSVQINPIPTADAGMDVAICAGDNTTLSAKGSGIYAWSPTTGLSDPTIANPVASPTTTTIYTLTVTANGCTATDMVEVTVNPAPPANVPDVTICKGESKQLNATGGITYAWSPATGLSSTTLGTPIASPTVTTDYMVTITNSSGCSIIDTVKVTVAPTPVTNAGQDVTLCAGQTASLMATGSSFAAYSWTPALGLDQANIANPTANPASTTDYIVSVMSVNGCVGKDTVQVIINPAGPPVANAGPDVAVCSGQSVNLSGTGTGTYAWTPAATLSNPAIANPIATPTDTTEYVLTVTDVTGCKDTDTIIVSPMPTADAGALSVINICEGQTVALDGQGLGTYSWSPAAGLSATNIANPIASPTTTTTYTLSVLSNGCTATDTIRINVSPAPILDAGLDVTTCFGDSVQLNVIGSGITSYAWSPSAGLSATNIANPKAAPANPATYKVTGTNSNGCAAIDSVKIMFQLPIIIADAGPDTIICKGDAVQLNATGGGTYAWSPATGLSATNIANPIATPTDTITYTVTVTDANGCSRTDDVEVFVTPLPAANAGLDVSICNGGSTLLSASGGSGYAWSPTTGLSDPTIANPIASPTNTTNYTVTVSTAGCISTTTDDVLVTVGGGTAPMANAGVDVSICSGDMTQLSATGGVSYSWSPATGLSATNIANPMANPTDTTIYTVEVTDANGCKDVDQVQVNILPLPVAVAGPDISICGGMGQALLSVGQAGNTYAWSPTAGLSDPSIAMPFASPQDSTVYVLTVTNNAGCVNTDTVAVNAQLIYVDLNATGANDGSSWADAYTDLQNAIDHPCVSNIWVAQGTYLPTEAHNGNTSDPRLKSFHFDSVAVNIYGGFSGSETDVSQRNSVANLTVLSGDFLGNDVITGTGATLNITNNAENAYRVVVTTNLDSTSVFSGFTVSGANSTGAPPFPFNAPSGIATSRFLANNAGGGMVNIGSSPTIADCIFTHNLGDGVHGGGMGNYALAAPTISNSIFANNLADNGGGMYNENAAPTIINCAFTGNVASNNGGGINNNTNAAPTIINSTFTDNLADNGGGMHNSSATPVIINSIIWGNTATTADNAINNLISTPSISFSLIEGSGGSSNWNTSVGTDGGNNLDSDPLFADAVNGDYTLSSCSPAINQGDGDNSASINTSTSDLGANARFYNSTIIDLGAYEYQNAAQSVVANAGSDVTINTGQNTQLMATGGTNYAWSPATGLSATNIANPVASPTVTTTYTVAVTDANGCMDMDTVKVTVVAPPGAALNFDGTDDYINCTNSTALQLTNGTAEAWIKTSNAGTGFRGIIVKGSAYGLFLRDNTLTLFDWGANVQRITTSTLNDDQWHHVAVTFISGVANGTKVYIDGVLVLTTTITVNSQTNPLVIGNGGIASSQNFKGSIDEVRIWNRVLSECEIQEGMSCEFSGSETGLEAYYQFNQGLAGQVNPSETSLTDATGNGHTGTLTNFTLTGTTSNWIETGGVTTGMACLDITIACPSIAGAALNFDGTDDYIVIPSAINSAIGNQITVEGWFNFETTPANLTAFITEGFFGDQNIQFCIYSDGTNTVTGFYNGAWHTTSTPLPPLNTWVHIAATYDQSHIKLYYDGVLKASLAKTIALPNGTEEWRIGRRWDLVDCIDGAADEIRIWSRALSACEIEEGMSCEFSGSETGLEAYYQFNQGLAGQANPSETSLVDATGNGHTGTLTNFALTGTASNWVETGGVTTGTACPDMMIACPIPPGAALSFDGTNDYVAIPTHSDFEFADGTVELWMKATYATLTYHPVLVANQQAGANTRWSYHLNKNRAGLIAFDGVAGKTWNYSFNQNEWYHIAFVENGSNTAAYVNGVSIGTLAINSSGVTGVPLHIGSNGVSELFPGSIDEVRIWNRPLRVCEIEEGMSCELSGSETGLKAYYQFNQGLAEQANPSETSLADITGNGHTGTLTNFTLTGTTSNWVETGGVTTGMACPDIAIACPILDGAALDFDGINDYVSLPSNTNISSAFTVEFWHKPIATGAHAAVASSRMAFDGFTFFLFNGTSPQLWVADDNNAGATIWTKIISPTAVTFGQWQHWAGVYDGVGNIYFYINGNLIGSTPLAGSFLSTPTNPLFIGKIGNGFPYKGQVDEVRIWNRSLNECEIQEGMSCELSGSEPGLEAYYQFNQGLAGQANPSETSLEDVTGNGHDGTLTNFALTGTASNWIETGGVTTGMTCPDIAIACPILDGAALNFDGIDDYVNCTNNTALQLTNGTAEAWMKTSNAGTGFRGIIVKGGAYGLFLRDNTLTLFDWGANVQRITTSTLNDDQWHHVAVTFVSGVANGTKVYLDGNLVLTTTITVGNQNFPLTIGNGGTSTPQRFNGSIDEARIWNRVLSACEIQEGMNCELSGSETGLLAYYQFNQGLAGRTNTHENVLKDVTGNGHDGTLTNFNLIGEASNWVETGGVTTGTTCMDIDQTCALTYAAALDFDGTNDYVAIPSALNARISNAITVEGWFNFETTPANLTAFITEGFFGDQNIQFCIYSNGTNAVAGFYNGAWHTTSTPLPSLNTWVHIAATYDQQNIKLYYDGVLQSTTPKTLVLPNGTEEWRIGRRWDLADYINGSVDEVRIWSRALSECEIQEGMNCELSGSETGLLAYYQFNQGLAGEANPSEISLEDITGNGHDGILTNFALTGTASNWIATGGVTTGTTCMDIDQTCGITYAAGLDFDGTNDHITIPSALNASISNVITIEGWFKLKSPATAGTFITEGFMGDQNVEFCIYSDGNNILTGFYNGAWHRTSALLPTLDTWVHIAATYDQQNIKLYYDGVLQSTTPKTVALPTGTEIWRIGRQWDTNGASYVKGALDEIRIWNRALNECEIQAGMNCELSGTEAGLKAYYPFNQGLAGQANAGETSLKDATGNGHNGTLINFTLTGTTSNWVATGGVTTGTACPNIAAACPSLVEIAPTSKIDNINQPALISNEAPINFQVSPNPFVNQTKLSFDLPKAETISIQVFDRTGRLVEEVVSMEKREAGSYQMMLSDENLYNGLFYIILQTPTERVVKKVIAIKDGRGRSNDDD